MTSKPPLGGVIHTYQQYDPAEFPSPTAEPPDMVSPAFEHLLTYGSMRHLTDEELAKAVRLDPSQIAGLGPSLDALIAMLEERKRKILEKYETDQVQKDARQQFQDRAEQTKPPKHLKKPFRRAVKEQQLYDLEMLWYEAGDERLRSRNLVQLIAKLGDQYQVEQLASKYPFTGRETMTVPQALEIKKELEQIDKLLEQLKEAAEHAQIGILDMDLLEQFAEPQDVQQLGEFQQKIQEFLKQIRETQGIEQSQGGQLNLTPKAMRIFQSRLLTEIFTELKAARSGRHQGPIVGEGAVEIPKTKDYEFGDSVTHMDIPGSLINAMIRAGESGLPVRMKPEDIVIHHTRNNPKCATAVLLDMSGSMRYGGLYVDVKRMGLALDGLIRTEFPGDFLQFIEIYSLPKPRHISEIPQLMPKPVTVFDPVVHLKADMSREEITESMIPPHFTNIQHAMKLGRQFLAHQDTPNRQMVLITDGLPTAHFEGETLYLLYPPDPHRRGDPPRSAALHREGITINLFLLQTWNQTEEDVRFAYRMAEMTKGRVFFSAGKDLDRFVVHDYLRRRSRIIS